MHLFSSVLDVSNSVIHISDLYMTHSQAGAFEFIVRAIQEAHEKQPEINRAAYNLIATLCFGHDGREGFGDPALASARREHAVAAGVIEALADALKHDRSVGVGDVVLVTSSLAAANRAVMRLLLGYDAETQVCVGPWEDAFHTRILFKRLPLLPMASAHTRPLHTHATVVFHCLPLSSNGSQRVSLLRIAHSQGAMRTGGRRGHCVRAVGRVQHDLRCGAVRGGSDKGGLPIGGPQTDERTRRLRGGDRQVADAESVYRARGGSLGPFVVGGGSDPPPSVWWFRFAR